MGEESSNSATKSGELADRTFQHIETFAYVVLGLLLAVAALAHRSSVISVGHAGL